MRILDSKNNEITEESLDFNEGYLIEDQILVKKHPAQEYIPAKVHYELVEFYPDTGGVDAREIVDVEEQEACEAWDEYEEVRRFVPYSDDELRERQIVELQGALAATNDVVMEIAEGLATWDDYPEVQAERAQLRAQIKELNA